MLGRFQLVLFFSANKKMYPSPSRTHAPKRNQVVHSKNIQAIQFSMTLYLPSPGLTIIPICFYLGPILWPESICFYLGPILWPESSAHYFWITLKPASQSHNPSTYIGWIRKGTLVFHAPWKPKFPTPRRNKQLLPSSKGRGCHTDNFLSFFFFEARKSMEISKLFWTIFELQKN